MKAHKQTQSIVNRLSRIEGHIRSIKKMIADEKSCSDILIQVAAVRAAMEKVGKILLQDHLETCVVESSKNGNISKLMEDLKTAIDRLVI
ncbi:MAG: metal-sensing transcriptional repressor [Firmicutes bacterium]|nr:metal-sensing transcriptional repressor [Bacillota bacterium]